MSNRTGQIIQSTAEWRASERAKERDTITADARDQLFEGICLLRQRQILY